MRLIGGVVFRDPARPAPDSLLQAMARRIAGVRQPVCASRGHVGFFSCIEPGGLDLTERVWALADLDLTNLPELHALAARGDGRSDRLLTTLYRTYGPAFIARLRGAFALALWDRRFHRLLLAVDRFGVKRLYYVRTPEGFTFASRPSPLLALPELSAEVDPTAVYQYLNFGFVPAPYSAFARVRRLPPGHTLVLRNAEPTIARYWDLAYPERPVGVREAAAATFRMVEDAVAVSLHGAAAKETGAFLSGGTDSSTIVGLMTKTTGERVHAFSIGFREPRYNELHYATLTARHFAAAHGTAILTPERALSTLPRLIEAHDEPFGNDSSVATYACAQLARDRGMTRLLGGDGGDELFGGNERYRTDRILVAYQRIPGGLRRSILEPLLAWLPDGDASLLGRAQRYVHRANLPTPRRFYFHEFFMGQDGFRLLTPEFARMVDREAPWKVAQQHLDSAQATSELNRLLYLDLKLTIGDGDLLKVTRAAELAGIDVRFPMLDHLLAEFTGTLPACYKVRRFEKRYLFKRAFRNLIPAEVLAKRKHGFGVPVSAWLKSDPGFRQLLRESLLSPGAHVQKYLRQEGIRDLVRLHEADGTPYYGSLLWILLMLELWHRQHANGVGV
ncbi:MAG: hypothetical protein HYS14_07020 [Candidatus Rokubacteria bacterium]|nr:hypothetical protein [Candidatus Rokubacteria bacterium]